MWKHRDLCPAGTHTASRVTQTSRLLYPQITGPVTGMQPRETVAVERVWTDGLEYPHNQILYSLTPDGNGDKKRSRWVAQIWSQADLLTRSYAYMEMQNPGSLNSSTVLLEVMKMTVKAGGGPFVVWSVNRSRPEEAHLNCTLNLGFLC